MEPHELIQLFMSAVELMDKTSSNKVRYKAICNCEGRIYEYRWKQPNVVYDTSDKIFVIYVEAFLDGEWELILKETSRCDYPTKEWVYSAIKSAFGNIMCYGINHCVQAKKSLKEYDKKL